MFEDGCRHARLLCAKGYHDIGYGGGGGGGGGGGPIRDSPSMHA